ncbi:MAG: ATP-dependent DNA helicase RecQ [Gemmatimonadota bacterium]
MASSIAELLSQASQLLGRHFGYSDFRPLQRRVIQAVLAGHDTLAVLPTGGGKSICFQIPALVKGGLTLVVSPLISLMQDQVEALRRRGIAAAAMNSSLSAPATAEIWRNLKDGRLHLLYVSPERLGQMVSELRSHGIRPALLAVDEAHCISEWGHDFRPGFRQINRAAYLLGTPPIVALTGSATPTVRDDIAASLRLKNPRIIQGSFDRPNLWFGVTPVADERSRFAALLAWCGQRNGTAIVYAPTRGQTEILTVALRERSVRAAPYHAGLESFTRAGTLRGFLDGDLDIVVATSAFGMGIDKPDVRLVVHWAMPPTMESYYQEAGRAGRDGAPARCVLLYSAGDAGLARRQLETTFPAPALVEKIWQGPKNPPGISDAILESAARLRRELRPHQGPVDWAPVRTRKRLALDRIKTMERYAECGRCRRATMLTYFAESARNCSGCDRCAPHIPRNLSKGRGIWGRGLRRLAGF